MTISEIVSISAGSTVIIGALFRQLRKLKKGIEFQIHQIRDLKERTERIDKYGSKPMQDILKKLNQNG
jgi:hypothetical protein